MADNKLPPDFPKRDELARGGFLTREQVRAAGDADLRKQASISATDVRAIRDYEAAHPEQTTTAPPPPPPADPATQTSPSATGASPAGAPSTAASPPPTGPAGSQVSTAGTSAAGASAQPDEQTEELNLPEPYLYKGVTYGPGVGVAVPGGLANNLRRRKLLDEGSQTVRVITTVPTTPHGGVAHADPAQNFANEQLAPGFPFREALESKGITKRSELTRLTDVELIQMGFSREAVAQMREGLRMTQL